MLLAENPFRRASPKQKKERKRNTKKRKRKIIVIKRILQIQNVSLVAKWNVFAGNVLLNRDNKPCQSTPGSSGLDLSSTITPILTPDVWIAQIPTGVAGPLPEDILDLC